MGVLDLGRCSAAGGVGAGAAGGGVLVEPFNVNSVFRSLALSPKAILHQRTPSE